MRLLQTLNPFRHSPSSDGGWERTRPCREVKTTSKMQHPCGEIGPHDKHKCTGQRCRVTWTTS